MREIILAKYGEMALKGLNRGTFEDVLTRNIRRRLSEIGEFSYARAQSTIYITPRAETDRERGELLDEAMPRLKKIFGIAALSKALVCEKNFDDIRARAKDYLAPVLSRAKTFKVEAKRADKAFPMKSPQICAELGAALLEDFGHLRVDVENPEVTVTVEIRDTNAYLHAAREKGAGGLPVGTSGACMLLLSGGIDSPVAGWRMARRGCTLCACHFASPPYTSERAVMKVEQLCEKLTVWSGSIAFFCVPFTEIGEMIRNRMPPEYTTIIMRRLMVEIACELAKRHDCAAIATGESLGQVASQTLPAIAAVDAAATIPVLRPLIGADKTEIVARARQIGTFETSIEPYEDCCSVFTPPHPKLRPDPERVAQIQSEADFAPLVARAVEGTTKKVFSWRVAQEGGFHA